jgi:hypothetical protein
MLKSSNFRNSPNCIWPLVWDEEKNTFVKPQYGLFPLSFDYPHDNWTSCRDYAKDSYHATKFQQVNFYWNFDYEISEDAIELEPVEEHIELEEVEVYDSYGNPYYLPDEDFQDPENWMIGGEYALIEEEESKRYPVDVSGFFEDEYQPMDGQEIEEAFSDCE